MLVHVYTLIIEMRLPQKYICLQLNLNYLAYFL